MGEEARRLASDAQDAAVRGGEQIKSAAVRGGEQIKSAAARGGEQARDQVGRLVDHQKEQAAARLGSLADALRHTASSLEDGETESAGLGRAADRAAEQVDRFAGYLRDRDLPDLVADLEGAARRHPDVFLGATFLSGLLLARFLKSSSERPRASRESEEDWGGYETVGSPAGFDLQGGGV